MKITRPATPAVEAVGRMHITGNVTPHVWYHRSEFRTAAGRPNRNMITIASDLLYWHRPEEVRDEEQGGIFVGYARKFQRDLLQYNYARRGAVFGMSDREVKDACTALQKAGLISIHYRTERIKGRLCHNIVYIELIPEAYAATLKGPDIGPVTKVKGAKRGRHARAEGTDDVSPAPVPEAEDVPDETAGVDDEGEDDGEDSGEEQQPGDLEEPTPDDSGTLQNLGELTLQNLEGDPSKFRNTYNESSSETSSLRERGGVTDSDRAAQASPAPPASSGDTARSKNKYKTAPALLEPPQDNPPDGGAADAAGEAPSLSLEEIARLFGDETRPATDSEKVPGGAAAGGPPATDAGPGPSVQDLSPIPQGELLARPLAPEGGEVYRALREVLGQALPTLIGEDTRTGSLPRREYWPRLTGAEVREVTGIARAEAQRTQGNMLTLAVRGLDRRVGAVRAAQPAQVPKRASPEPGGQDPAEIARHDPLLRAGQRCTVDGLLGVVFLVSALGYLVDLDDGERLTIDRALAWQLKRLTASDAPFPQKTGEAQEGERVVILADVGSRWRPKEGGDVVSVQEVVGVDRVLSNKVRLPLYALTLKFERVET